MKKILITMDSATQIQQLEEQLSGMFHVVVCNNGLDGLEILKEFEPDVVVVNLMLSGMDGISMLELAWDCGIRPQVIAITEHISDYIINALERMNVSCLFRGNCETCYLIARIIDVAQWQDDSAQGKRFETILASLGFKMNTSGCKITQLALEKFAEDTTQKVTSELYPAVAAETDGSTTQVEKAIRDSIDCAWEERNERVWQMFFDARKNGRLIKPSNREFLARIVRCVCNSEIKPKRKIG